MQIETRKLADLCPAEYNPRKKLAPGDPEYEKIARSIEDFGYCDPIIINKDGTIIGGHQRCTVLQDLGETEADVIVLDLSKDDEKALNIALNKIGGEWDMQKLRDALGDLTLSKLDVNTNPITATTNYKSCWATTYWKRNTKTRPWTEWRSRSAWNSTRTCSKP